MSRIAVVIPLYNHQNYIAAALRSVLEQTRPTDRIVIVDDGSSDDSVKIVRANNDPRITLFTQENSGAHIALNRAIAEAARDCEFIAILNSDDIYHPKRLEKTVAFLEKNPMVKVVCTRFIMISETGAPLANNHPKMRWVKKIWDARSADPAEWLGIANFTKTTSNLVARSRYLLAHPFRDYRYIHDYFFAIIAALEDKLAVLDEPDKPLLSYRAHASNTIKSGPPENLTREMLRMNLDVLRESASLMANAPAVRDRYTRFLRLHLQNFADFRAEAFTALVAAAVAKTSEDEMRDLIKKMNTEQFPELVATRNKSAFDSLTANPQKTR